MVTDERLEDIENDLRSAPEFFKKILSIINSTGEDKELCTDIEAAPEFFEEMLQIVEELRSYRKAILPANFNEYKMRMICDIPVSKSKQGWGKRKSSF